MHFVKLLLVFLHLLGMGVLVGAFLSQLKADTVTSGWLHGAGLQLITGVALVVLAPATGAEYNHIKIGVKLVVLAVIGGLAFAFAGKPAAKWFAPTLGGLVVVNVGLAVFWA